METWPPGLPAGWLVGAPINIKSGVKSGKMLSGHVRQRVAMASPFDTFNIEFIFTDLELRVFEYFVREKLNSADWFTGPFHDGGGQQTGTIRFLGGAYDESQDPETGRWKVTTTVEVDGRK